MYLVKGTRTPIAITIFVKNPDATEHGKIYFHDIGDYLSQEQKLEKITNYKALTVLQPLMVGKPLSLTLITTG
jgi:predicted helicase